MLTVDTQTPSRATSSLPMEGAIESRRGRNPHGTTLLAAGVVLLATMFVSPTNTARAANTVAIGTVAADPGTTGVAVNVSITNDDPVHAVSLSLRYDQIGLSLTHVDLGTDVLDAPFFNYKHDENAGEVVAGIILTFPNAGGTLESGELAPTDAANPHVVAALIFDIAPGANPGDLSIELEDGLGDPPVSNALSNAGSQIAIGRADLTDGTIAVNNLYRLRLQDTEAVQGAGFSVITEVQTPQPMSGGSFAFTYDNSVFTANSASYFSTDAAAELSLQVDSGSAGIEFFQFENKPEFQPGLDRAVVGFVNDFNPPFDDQVIAPTAPGEWKSVIRFSIVAINDPALLGQTRDLVFTDADTQGLVDNRFIIGQSSVEPEVFHGLVTFVDGFPFVRGTINPGSGRDISDAIWFLQWLFLGLVQPVCEAAADINDDERHDISDVIFFLSWLLLGLAEPPPPLHMCALDPDGQTFSCDQPYCP